MWQVGSVYHCVQILSSKPWSTKAVVQWYGRMFFGLAVPEKLTINDWLAMATIVDTPATQY